MRFIIGLQVRIVFSEIYLPLIVTLIVHVPHWGCLRFTGGSGLQQETDEAVCRFILQFWESSWAQFIYCFAAKRFDTCLVPTTKVSFDVQQERHFLFSTDRVLFQSPFVFLFTLYKLNSTALLCFIISPLHSQLNQISQHLL